MNTWQPTSYYYKELTLSSCLPLPPISCIVLFLKFRTFQQIIHQTSCLSVGENENFHFYAGKRHITSDVSEFITKCQQDNSWKKKFHPLLPSSQHHSFSTLIYPSLVSLKRIDACVFFPSLLSLLSLLEKKTFYIITSTVHSLENKLNYQCNLFQTQCKTNFFYPMSRCLKIKWKILFY